MCGEKRVEEWDKEKAGKANLANAPSRVFQSSERSLEVLSHPAVALLTSGLLLLGYRSIVMSCNCEEWGLPEGLVQDGPQLHALLLLLLPQVCPPSPSLPPNVLANAPFVTNMRGTSVLRTTSQTKQDTSATV